VTFGGGGGGISTTATATTPGAAAASTAGAAASTPAAAPPAPQAELVLDYQNMTVEQILNAFQKYLEGDAAAFVEESQRVLDHDAVLRQSQRDLALLATHAQTLCAQQNDVQQQLLGIEAQQSSLDQQLRYAEGLLDSLFASQSHLAPTDADVQREKTYTTALAVDQRLSALTDQLKESLKLLDEAATSTSSSGSGGGDSSNSDDHRNLLAILNQHQNALAEIELTSQRVEHDMKRIQLAMSGTSSSTSSVRAYP
jgi:Nsp1-like C-terminal region